MAFIIFNPFGYCILMICYKRSIYIACKFRFYYSILYTKVTYDTYASFVACDQYTIREWIKYNTRLQEHMSP